MKTVTALAALCLASAAAPSGWAAPADDVASLAWLSGTWIQEKDGVTTRETWLAPMGGTMSGAGQTNAPGKKPFVEYLKISVEPAGATFTATLPGQPPTPFVLVPGKPGEWVFENKAHDFPQRVIFRRCADGYCPRIEGVMNGKLEFEEWRYARVR